VHDVALQRLPVIFCLDRAIAGKWSDHHGNLDRNGYVPVFMPLKVNCGSRSRAGVRAGPSLFVRIRAELYG
jgi:deoxyxylulose-5-phosphate synthase